MVLVVLWYCGTHGTCDTRGTVVLLVPVVLWDCMNSTCGTRGTVVLVVLWYSWHCGTRGTVVLVVLWDSWY